MEEIIKEVFGNRIRIRCSGILIRNNKLLLINHSQLTKNNIFWNPPGGGLLENETLEACLKREFLEETGLEIEVKSFLGMEESIHLPLHAIELFFNVSSTSENIKKGSDPELPINKQLIIDLKWVSKEELLNLKSGEKHPFLNKLQY